MANFEFVFTNNTFAGEELAGYMARTLLEADSIKRGLITPIQNCKSRKVILLVDDEVVFQDPSAIFHDQGTDSTQTERYLDPVTYEFMKAQAWDSLVQSWEQSQLKPGALEDYNGVIELSDFLIERYVEKIQIANERLYWLGKTNVTEVAFTAAYPGLLNKIAGDTDTNNIKLSSILNSSFTVSAIDATTGICTASSGSVALLSDGDVVTLTNTFGNLADTTGVGDAQRPSGWAGYGVISTSNPQSYSVHILSTTTFKLVMNYNEMGNRKKKATFSGTATVSGSAATISFVNAQNVLAVLGSIYAQVDEATRNKPDFNIMVPYNVSRAYAIAQANKATNVLNAFVDKKVMDFLGDKLQVMEQWRGNSILAGRASNLFLGVDLLSDTSRLKTIYTGDYTGDELVKMRARMKSDTNYAFANELLYVSA